MTQVQKSLTARKWYDSKKSSVSWSSSRLQKLLRTVTHLYCCSHRVPLPCLVIQPEISCKGGSENLWRWGAETMSWIKYRSNTNRYELYHPIAPRQFQRHWSDATFCFFLSLALMTVINSQLLIGHCNMDESVTNEKQWNLILAGAKCQARLVMLHVFAISLLPWWQCLRPH